MMIVRVPMLNNDAGAVALRREPWICIAFFPVIAVFDALGARPPGVLALNRCSSSTTSR